MPLSAAKGHVLLSVLGAASLGALGWVSFHAATAPATSTLSDHDLVLSLNAVGLDPESLAAAGVSAVQVSSLIDDARDHLSEQGAAVQAATEAWVQASNAHDAIRQRVQGGVASQVERAQLTQALANLGTAKEALDLAHAGIFDTATENLPQASVQALVAIHANRSWGLPVQYLVTSRSEPEWVQLREALAACRIAGQCGSEVPAAADDIVDTAASGAATATAAVNLETNGATVTEAWDAAVGN